MSTKTEIVKQVKLTPNQRIALMQAAADGGRFNHTPDWGVLQPLRFLRLVEQRPKYEGKELASVRHKINDLWKKVPAIVRAKDARALDKISSDIRSYEYDLERTVYWLTPAAHEYLTLGKVTVLAGRSDE